ncbi:hypothetical protein CWE12_03420 [Aliidiomarina sedimenti]|uniref:DUF3192 domain-containing protein n=1 Tax=Aliidiomarina sedimenti TaxID=1933879 RepID=A0ABY0C3N0_9GAMM|nr:DUF3192 domain-containing protein [Aliidiomarina sedimenti]RUO32050.1 hypothetical protein CWE12_03420 [Aliidiomarina sedimenti]
MKSLLAMTLLVPLALSASACVVVVDGDKSSENSRSQSDWERQESRNRQALNELHTQQPMAEVIERMGNPDFDEQLRIGERSYRVLYYRTQRVESDGMTTKDECTPIVFERGELYGWGENQLKVLLSSSN